MSSEEDYTDDDFEEDFEDLTKTGVPATASAVEESTDNFLDGSVNNGRQLMDSSNETKLNSLEKFDQNVKKNSDKAVISNDAIKVSPMSRQKRWSEICKASQGKANTVEVPAIAKPERNKSLAVKEHKRKIEAQNRERRKELISQSHALSRKVSSTVSNGGNRGISKVAAKKNRQKRKRHRQKIIQKIKGRSKTNPLSYGRMNSKQSQSLKSFLSMKASPSLPSFNYCREKAQNTNIPSAVSPNVLQSPFINKFRQKNSIMDEIPKAVWQIHAKLNEKEMRLKAKERALQACEDALIAREKAITIRENAIDEKVLKFGLHDYDPKLSVTKNDGCMEQRSKRGEHLLPSFAANTQCPKDSSDTEADVETTAACESQDAKQNSCAPESNSQSSNVILPGNGISATDPESMSSQLLHLFDNSKKQDWHKSNFGLSTVHKHADLHKGMNQNTISVYAAGDKDSLERTFEQSNSKRKACNEKAFVLPQVKDCLPVKSRNCIKKNGQKKRSRGKDISRRHLRGSKQKFSGLYSVGRPSLSNFI